jgi:hypothetical protein
LGQPHVIRPGSEVSQNKPAVNAADQSKKYIEEQYSKYVKELGQLLDNPDDN